MTILPRLIVAPLVLALAVSAAGAQVSLPPFLEVRVPKPPTVATAEGASFLAYEVHVTNFMPQAVTLKKIDVLSGTGDHRVLLSLSDSTLVRAVTRPGAAPMGGTERLKLNGGARAVVFMWLPLATGEAPKSIQHRLTIEAGAGDSAKAQQLDAAVVPVTADAVVIGPPLRGGVWLTGNGPAAESGHRRALIPVGGVPAIAQRFAIDYVKVADDNKTFKGDQLKNENYYAE